MAEEYDDDIYSESTEEEQLREDGIDPKEAGFMKGYETDYEKEYEKKKAKDDEFLDEEEPEEDEF